MTIPWYAYVFAIMLALPLWGAIIAAGVFLWGLASCSGAS